MKLTHPFAPSVRSRPPFHAHGPHARPCSRPPCSSMLTASMLIHARGLRVFMSVQRPDGQRVGATRREHRPPLTVLGSDFLAERPRPPRVRSVCWRCGRWIGCAWSAHRMRIVCASSANSPVNLPSAQCLECLVLPLVLSRGVVSSILCVSNPACRVRIPYLLYLPTSSSLPTTDTRPSVPYPWLFLEFLVDHLRLTFRHTFQHLQHTFQGDQGPGFGRVLVRRLSKASSTAPTPSYSCPLRAIYKGRLYEGRLYKGRRRQGAAISAARVRCEEGPQLA